MAQWRYNIMCVCVFYAHHVCIYWYKSVFRSSPCICVWESPLFVLLTFLAMMCFALWKSPFSIAQWRYIYIRYTYVCVVISVLLELHMFICIRKFLYYLIFSWTDVFCIMHICVCVCVIHVLLRVAHVYMCEIFIIILWWRAWLFINWIWSSCGVRPS